MEKSFTFTLLFHGNNITQTQPMNRRKGEEDGCKLCLEYHLTGKKKKKKENKFCQDYTSEATNFIRFFNVPTNYCMQSIFIFSY